MMALALAAMTASLPNGAGRLSVGSRWHCAAALADDRYSLDFIIERTGDGDKKLRVLTSSEPDINGYAIGDEIAARYDKSFSELVLEFGHIFSQFGLSFFVQWNREDETVSVDAKTWNVKATTFEEKNYRSYLFQCRRAES